MLPEHRAKLRRDALGQENRDARADADRPPPDWCVDTGTDMQAMTTFELWMALARGDVDGKASVWRDGMENWQNVEDVPELAYAMSDSLSLAPPPVIPTPTAVISVRTNDRTPLGFGTTDVGTEELLGGPELRSVPLPIRGFSFGGMKAALAAVAVAAAAAVGLSYLPQGASTEAPAAAVERPLAVARLHAAMERANRQVAEATQRRLETVRPAAAPASSSARQHKEVGQRRSRRGRH
jgi:hypothetical protein